MAFTMFDKFGDAASGLPEEERDALFAAICEYGFYGTEPDLPVHLHAMFKLMRDDIDNSAEMRKRGSNGGRPKNPQENKVIENPKPEVSENVKPEVSENVKPEVSENVKPEVSESSKPEISENEKPEVYQFAKPEVSKNSKPKPNQTKPNQSRPEEGNGAHAHFIPPTVDEISDYCRSHKARDGTPDPLDVDAERFWDYYAAQKWRLSNGNRMSNWQAAVRNWARSDRKRDRKESSVGDAYSRL